MSKHILRLMGALALSAILTSCSKGGDTENLNQTDRDFMMGVTYVNLGEVDAGNMAMQHAVHSAIAAYGQLMVTDHSMAHTDMMAVAGNEGVQLPAETDQEHKDMAAMLSMQQGEAFDSMYIHMMVSGHDKAISLHEHELQHGQSEAVRQYAADKLEKIRHHRMMADSLAHAMYP